MKRWKTELQDLHQIILDLRTEIKELQQIVLDLKETKSNDLYSQ